MFKTIFLRLSVLLALTGLLAVSAAAQRGDGTPEQRLEVMRQKLDTMKRSLNSATSVLKAEDKDVKGSKDDPESPLGRLSSIEKETSSLLSEVNSLRGKVTRAEKYEMSDIDGLEDRVSLLQSRVDNALLETADARAATVSDVGQPRTKKKKGKFLWIFGGGGDDEYEELIGNVTPGRGVCKR